MLRRVQLQAMLIAGVIVIVAALPASPISPPADGNDLIYACVKKVNGQLRVVDTPARCGPSERWVSWSSGSVGQAALPPPDFDSGWVDVAKGEHVVITHGLDTPPERMLIHVLAQNVPHDPDRGIYIHSGYMVNLNSSTYELKNPYGPTTISFHVLIWVY